MVFAERSKVVKMASDGLEVANLASRRAGEALKSILKGEVKTMMNPQGYIINIGSRSSLVSSLPACRATTSSGMTSPGGLRRCPVAPRSAAGAVVVSQQKHRLRKQDHWPAGKNKVRWKFLALPFVAALCIGLLLLIVSPRPLTFAGLAGGVRGDCLALCADPLIGLVDKPPVALLGAGLIYVTLLYGAVSNYHSTTEVLAEALPVVASKGLVVGVFCYLILSSRWTYYRLFCYEEMDHWVRSALDVFIPFSLLGIGVLPTVVDTLQLLFIGA